MDREVPSLTNVTRPNGYLGSKSASGVYQAIISAMPRHENYIETHYGSGVIARTKPACTRCTVIDRDRSVFARWPAPSGAEIVIGDCVEFLSSKSFGKDTFIYADPPYLLTTRSSSKRYRYEYTEDDHVSLADTLKSTGARFMVSGYPSKLYDRIYSGFRKYEFQAMTRGGVRTECIWMNYEEQDPHWHTFAGRDRTDRQRIRRKAERWAANYRACTPSERLAILSALLNQT